MKAISEKRNFDNKTVTFIWHPAKRLDLPVWQVYVFCVTKDNKVVLVRDKGEDRFTLLGGRTKAGEKAEETAKRETKEEAQKLKNLFLLGSLEVISPNEKNKIQRHHQQVRFISKVQLDNQFIPRKCLETEERILIEVGKLPNYLSWLKYPTGKAQYRAFLRHIEK